MRVIFVHFTSLAFTALATHFFFFYKCRRHFKLDRRTLAKYKTNLALHELSFSQTSKKNPNCWGKRDGGPQLILDCKQYWKRHLITSPKKNDFVFKHVRGDGKHFMQELNGVKQLVCAPGE